MSLKFYHAYPSRSAIVHWMLEEIGQPFEMVRLNFAMGDHKQPDYLAINPFGKVPAIDHNGMIVTGTGAICAYLADAFPRAGLAPPPGDPLRASYYRWLFFAGTDLEPAIIETSQKLDLSDARGMVGWAPLSEVLDVIEQALEPGPYLLGERISAADIVLGSTLAWTMMFGLVEARPRFEAYVALAGERPAYRRSRERDEASRKFAG